MTPVHRWYINKCRERKGEAELAFTHPYMFFFPQSPFGFHSCLHERISEASRRWKNILQALAELKEQLAAKWNQPAAPPVWQGKDYRGANTITIGSACDWNDQSPDLAFSAFLVKIWLRSQHSMFTRGIRKSWHCVLYFPMHIMCVSTLLFSDNTDFAKWAWIVFTWFQMTSVPASPPHASRHDWFTKVTMKRWEQAVAFRCEASSVWVSLLFVSSAPSLPAREGVCEWRPNPRLMKS